jgi:hypothetical protein
MPSSVIQLSRKSGSRTRNKEHACGIETTPGRPNSSNLLNISSSTATTQTVRTSRAQKAKPRVWQPKSILSKPLRQARYEGAAAPKPRSAGSNRWLHPIPTSSPLNWRRTRNRSLTLWRTRQMRPCAGRTRRQDQLTLPTGLSCLLCGRGSPFATYSQSTGSKTTSLTFLSRTSLASACRWSWGRKERLALTYCAARGRFSLLYSPRFDLFWSIWFESIASSCNDPLLPPAFLSTELLGHNRLECGLPNEYTHAVRYITTRKPHARCEENRTPT